MWVREITNSYREIVRRYSTWEALLTAFTLKLIILFNNFFLAFRASKVKQLLEVVLVSTENCSNESTNRIESRFFSTHNRVIVLSKTLHLSDSYELILFLSFLISSHFTARSLSKLLHSCHVRFRLPFLKLWGSSMLNIDLNVLYIKWAIQWTTLVVRNSAVLDCNYLAYLNSLNRSWLSPKSYLNWTFWIVHNRYCTLITVTSITLNLDLADLTDISYDSDNINDAWTLQLSNGFNVFKSEWTFANWRIFINFFEFCFIVEAKAIIIWYSCEIFVCKIQNLKLSFIHF